MRILLDFAADIPQFARRSSPEKIEIFSWFLHEVRKQERVSAADISACFDAAHESRPLNVHRDLQRLCERKPPRMLRDSKGYRLSAIARRELGERLKVRQSTIRTTALLDGLSGRIRDPAHQAFLAEALVCFRNQAYRAAIVMSWNLAYSDVTHRILANDIDRFNRQRAKAFPKTKEITKRSDFEDLKESVVLEIARGAGLLSASSFKILDEKLGKRNTAAHPSMIVVSAVTAEEVISDLVENIILKDPL